MAPSEQGLHRFTAKNPFFIRLIEPQNVTRYRVTTIPGEI